MKIITLNTWGGKVQTPFIDFIKDNKDVDIFCLQEMQEGAREIMAEVYPDDMYDAFSELQNLLPDHTGYFRPALKGVFGLAIFVKKNILVDEEGEIFIHQSSNEDITEGHYSRNMQWVIFKHNGTDFIVVNVHGLWNGKGKDDTPERLAQSGIIKDFINKREGRKILCGDFNLNPETESIRMLEHDMKNLVKDFKVTSTRTSFYPKPGKFADYIFVSKDIEVKDFKVLPDEVSDHSPLYLEI